MKYHQPITSVTVDITFYIPIEIKIENQNEIPYGVQQNIRRKKFSRHNAKISSLLSEPHY